MKTLYFDCSSGISGDMTVASLLDLGVPYEVLQAGLQALKLPGFRVAVSRTQKCAIGAACFDVLLEDAHGDGGHEHTHVHAQDDHAHTHGHTHEQEHKHTHEHAHRNMNDIRSILSSSDLSAPVQALAVSIFERLAQAEGKIHEIAPEQVHFHEVGAVDSIVDIVGAAICLDWLAPDAVAFSAMREGKGFIRCQHGLIPVPAPATLELLKTCGAQIEFTDTDGEMITPTGAAIAAATGSAFGAACPRGKVIAVGYGAGKKDFTHPNLLRTMLVESIDTCDDTVCVLETVIDDATGEELAYAMSVLLESGVKDVYFTPVFMKKNRPAYALTVLCAAADEEKTAQIIFRHTTSIGMRKSYVERIVMARRTIMRDTKYGMIAFKECTYAGITRIYPEYESAAEAAKKHSVPIREVLARFGAAPDTQSADSRL